MCFLVVIWFQSEGKAAIWWPLGRGHGIRRKKTWEQVESVKGGWGQHWVALMHYFLVLRLWRWTDQEWAAQAGLSAGVFAFVYFPGSTALDTHSHWSVLHIFPLLYKSPPAPIVITGRRPTTVHTVQAGDCASESASGYTALLQPPSWRETLQPHSTWLPSCVKGASECQLDKGLCSQLHSWGNRDWRRGQAARHLLCPLAGGILTETKWKMEAKKKQRWNAFFGF